jgi:hypothetical protein
LWFVAGSLTAGAQESFGLPPATVETEHFGLDVPFGYTSADAGALEQQFEEVYEVVVARLGVVPTEKVRVTFSPPVGGPCGRRGSTMLLPNRVFITLFADRQTSTDQILGGLAHELGHVLQHVAVEGGRSIVSMFVEGFATWAAGPYWLRWQGATSFRSAVQSYVASGTYLPLHENDGFFDTLTEDAVSRLGEDCVSRRDVIYTEWGAFIEYLVGEYGRERLYLLFRTPPLESKDGGMPFRRPNFPVVYGRSLEQLEAMWLESVTAAD